MSVAEPNNGDAGRQFVITGGAGGNGRACARDLLDLGARALLVDVDDARLFAAVVELGGGQRLQAHRSMLESPEPTFCFLELMLRGALCAPAPVNSCEFVQTFTVNGSKKVAGALTCVSCGVCTNARWDSLCGFNCWTQFRLAN